MNNDLDIAIGRPQYLFYIYAIDKPWHGSKYKQQ